MELINLYTDGSSIGNPGRGGYGLILEYKGKTKEFSEGFRLTTNNRMELLSVIIGLEKINRSGIPIIVHSDSKYVVDAVNKGWVFAWEKKNFNKKKNIDLWKRFLKIYKKHNIQFKWIKGHSGHVQNERCDALAVSASSTLNLREDIGYEKNESQQNNLFN